MRYILLLLTILSLNSLADSLSFGIWTNHNDIYSCVQKCNENNRLIAYEHNNFILATFNNSYYRQTYLAAYGVPVANNIQLVLGLSYGYGVEEHKPPINPLVKFDIKDDSYNPKIYPYAAIKLSRSIRRFNISYLESITYRVVTLGINFN